MSLINSPRAIARSTSKPLAPCLRLFWFNTRGVGLATCANDTTLRTAFTLTLGTAPVSPRERWIVYPLLFFCFAMCIKLYWYPKYRHITAKSVVSEQLLLQDQFSRPVLQAGAQPQAQGSNGYLYLFAAPPPGALGQAPLPAVRLGVAPTRTGVVETMSELGQRLVEVAGDSKGGNVVLFDATGRPLLMASTRGIAALGEDPRAAPVRPPLPPPTVGNDAT